MMCLMAKQNMPMVSEGHSNRTRIETSDPGGCSTAELSTQKVIPIEQGLKPI